LGAWCVSLTSLSLDISELPLESETLYDSKRRLANATQRMSSRLERKYLSLLRQMQTNNSPRKLPVMTRGRESRPPGNKESENPSDEPSDEPRDEPSDEPSDEPQKDAREV